jgi:hypothetical protein
MTCGNSTFPNVSAFSSMARWLDGSFVTVEGSVGRRSLVVDVVGLCVKPPARALVFSFDENPVPGLGHRTQPSLLMKPSPNPEVNPGADIGLEIRAEVRERRLLTAIVFMGSIRFTLALGSLEARDGAFAVQRPSVLLRREGRRTAGSGRIAVRLTPAHHWHTVRPLGHSWPTGLSSGLAGKHRNPLRCCSERVFVCRADRI